MNDATTLLEDLRLSGWSVAVHNDYVLNGNKFTFWLLTKGNLCVKGEGPTDYDALRIAYDEAAHLTSMSTHTIEKQRHELWMLLDNIDTLDDACRENDAAFRQLARKHLKKRFEIWNSEESR